MKQHSIEFKDELIKMGKQIDSIITYVENGQTITLHEELYSVTPMFESNILKSVMKQLDFESSVLVPNATIVNYKLGILVGNTYEYLDYGDYVVYNVEKQEDKGTYKITCFDKMLYSMKPYEEINGTYPMTIKSYLSLLARKIGLTLKDTDFYNYSLNINSDLYKGLEYTYRDVLDEIAQATGSMIIVNMDNQIEVKYPTITNDTINEDFMKDVNVNFSEKYGPINMIVLSRSGESDNVYYPETIPENPCEIKIVDNQIMNFNDRSDYLEGIYNALNGLEYYTNDFNSFGVLYYEPGDLYNIQIGENTYKCLMLNDEINVTSGLQEIIHTTMPEESETDYSKADKTDRKINQTYIIVDKQNQRIDSVVSTVNAQNNKISQVTQTVDELNSKISDISDITTSQESNFAKVELLNVNESEPITIRVHPTGINISYLYPRNNLYPSDNLYMTTRILRFTNSEMYKLTSDTKYNNYTKYYRYDDENAEYILLTKNTDYQVGDTIQGNIYENDYVDYKLPLDLLYYNDNIYDEFLLDYDTKTCQIRKKVVYNADGTTSPSSSEITIDVEYPQILLQDGDYTVELLGYETAYLFVRLMAKNMYTSQFATRAELSSEISQTKEEIGLSVNQKLSDYSTTTQMNSAINIKADQITSTVSQTYETKSNATTNYSRLTQTATSLQSQINSNDEDISEINQNIDTIEINVGKKYNTSDFTNAKITAKINDGTSSVQISASKISLKGKTIDMTSDNIKINSNNFKVDKYGNITCNNANVSGTINASSGKIAEYTISGAKLVGKNVGMSGKANDGWAFWAGSNDSGSAPFRVGHDGSITATNAYISGTITASTIRQNTITGGTISGTTMSNSTYSASGVRFSPSSSSVSGFTTYSNQMVVRNNYGAMGLGVAYSNMGSTTNNLFIEDTSGDNWVTIQYQGGYTNGGWYSGSKEEFKKNFEELDKDKALDIVLNTDIYKYNLKNEDDNHHKHLGFIIGKKYNYSKDIVAVDNNGNEFGVDNYSMTSACYGAIQKLYEEIQKIKEKM